MDLSDSLVNKFPCVKCKKFFGAGHSRALSDHCNRAGNLVCCLSALNRCLPHCAGTCVPSTSAHGTPPMGPCRRGSWPGRSVCVPNPGLQAAGLQAPATTLGGRGILKVLYIPSPFNRIQHKNRPISTGFSIFPTRILRRTRWRTPFYCGNSSLAENLR